MILVRTNLIPKGFQALTVWPFIFVLPDCASDKGLIEHELVHHREQKRMAVLPWWGFYLLSRRFRLAQEVMAYKHQIAVGGIGVDAAAHYLTQYGAGIPLAEARELLSAAPFAEGMNRGMSAGGDPGGSPDRT